MVTEQKVPVLQQEMACDKKVLFALSIRWLGIEDFRLLRLILDFRACVFLFQRKNEDHSISETFKQMFNEAPLSHDLGEIDNLRCVSERLNLKETSYIPIAAWHAGVEMRVV